MLNEYDETFIAEFKNTFEQYFPLGWLSIGLRKGLGEYISIDFGLIPVELLTSKIYQNDPMHHSFIVYGEGDKYEVRSLTSGISINPEPNTWLAMGRVNTKFRNFTLEPEKALKRFETFLKRLRKLVDENESNIYGRDRYDDKYFN